MTGNKQTNADKSRGDADRSPAEVERKHRPETVKSALEKVDPVSRSVREALERSNPLRSLRGHDDILGSMLDRSNALGALVNFHNTTSLHDTVRTLTGVSQHEVVLATALDDMARVTCTSEDANRLMIGPLSELETSISGLSSQAISKEHERLQTIATQAAFQFRMPELNETARLPADFQSRNESVLGSLPVYSDSIKTAMDAIQEPWINVESASRSINAFCELFSMATHLIEREPYEDLLVDQLRQHLGDWRDELVLPSNIGSDLALRSKFYIEKGFNPGLAEFPNPVFEETLERGALRDPIPQIATEQGELPIPVPAGVEEAGLARTKRAHCRLTLLELHVREFIVTQMKATVGNNWIRQRVPHKMHEEWKNKQEKAKQAGQTPKDLIHYADFTDYASLMERSDNWKDVFKPVFGRKEDIRESWQRLFPVRNATKHARLISQDDELLLVFETKRILKAIGVLQ